MQSARTTAPTADYYYDDDDDPREPLPIVNPYAIIALVAALVALFPIAIVFSLISFTFPRGRGMGWSALILGCLQLGALLTVVVIGSQAFDEALSSSSGSSARLTAYTTPLAPIVQTATSATPSSVDATTTAELPTLTTPAARPASNEPCNEPMRITTGTDGNAMVCSGGGGVPRPVWQSTGKPLQPGIHDEGEGCNPSTTTRFGQNSAGHVVECLNPQRQPGQGSSGQWTTDVNAS